MFDSVKFNKFSHKHDCNEIISKITFSREYKMYDDANAISVKQLRDRENTR